MSNINGICYNFNGDFMKVLNITHVSDMDGRGCEVLTKLVFPDNEIILSEPGLVHEVIENLDYKKYDKIFITDLALTLKTGLIIEENPEFKSKVIHLDHHVTDIVDKNYSWSKVYETDETGFEVCGTTLYYDYLLENYPDNDILKRNSVKEVIEGIRCQDTYTFEKYNNTLGPSLTNVFANSDMDIFIESIIDRLKNGNLEHFELTNEEIDLIKRTEKEKADYIEECDKRLIRMNFLGYKVGLSISTKYRSVVGNKLSERHKDELDFILIADCNREKFSTRTVNDIDLNIICNQVGGGGHPKAAGFNMTKETLELVKPYLDEELVEKYKLENF